jgi:ABC-2 type transport system ATP-binding protein
VLAVLITESERTFRSREPASSGGRLSWWPATTGDDARLAAELTTRHASGLHDDGMAIIQAHGLTKNYGPVRAVDDLSFSVPSGSVTGFLGPNGAGKTTTLRMLLGLVAPDAGTATINGKAYVNLPEPLHEVGAVLEASSFHPGRTARNHLRIQALAAALDPSRIDDVLDLVQLSAAADRRIGGFSLGMRQRLGLATALLPDPEILILDEPANGLDPEGVHWLRGLLRGFAAEGGTVLVSSHMLAEAAQTVDSVVIIDRGRLITQSPLASLTAQGDLEDAFLQLTGHSSVKEALT